MRPIVTVTLNPAIDRTVWLDRLEPGTTHRTAKTRTMIGGKGINVARTAARLGAPVVALGIAGDDQAELIERHLGSLGIRARFLATPGETRTNLKVIEQDDGRMTEINGSGLDVSADLIERLEAELVAEVDRNGAAAVVLAGSLPPGVDPAVYANWTRRLERAALPVDVLVDASDEALARAVEAGPFLIKPNRVEAAALLGREIPSAEDAQAAAVELTRRGPRGVLLSLGAEGAVGAWDGTAEPIPARPIHALAGRLVSTVGAGDSMVARVAVELSRRGHDERVTATEFFAMCRLAVDEAAGQIAAGG